MRPHSAGPVTDAKALKGCTFGSDKEVKAAVGQRFQQELWQLVAERVLVCQWDACPQHPCEIFLERSDNGLFLCREQSPSGFR